MLSRLPSWCPRHAFWPVLPLAFICLVTDTLTDSWVSRCTSSMLLYRGLILSLQVLCARVGLVTKFTGCGVWQDSEDDMREPRIFRGTYRCRVYLDCCRTSLSSRADGSPRQHPHLHKDTILSPSTAATCSSTATCTHTNACIPDTCRGTASPGRVAVRSRTLNCARMSTVRYNGCSPISSA